MTIELRLDTVNRALVQNYFNCNGTLKNLQDTVGLPEGLKTKSDKELYYYLGFDSEDDLTKQLNEIETSLLEEEIGVPITNPYVAVFGEYLRGLDLITFENDTTSLGKHIQLAQNRHISFKMNVLAVLDVPDVQDVVKLFYPEIKVIEDVKQEGIYHNVLYVRQDIEVPKPKEVVAYLMGLDMIPSKKVVDYLSNEVKSIHVNEFDVKPNFALLYTELVLFSKRFNFLIADLYTSWGMEYFNHSKTIKDSVFVLERDVPNEEIYICLTNIGMGLHMKEKDFYLLYNRDVLQHIEVKEIESPNGNHIQVVNSLTDTPLYIELNKVLQSENPFDFR